MQTTIQKWGNSLAIRIPRSYAKDVNLQQGTEVDLVREMDKLVIIPKKTGIKLHNLLASVTPENIHKEEFAGGAVGKEIW
jgi:antitoxin MazE